MSARPSPPRAAPAGCDGRAPPLQRRRRQQCQRHRIVGRRGEMQLDVGGRCAENPTRLPSSNSFFAVAKAATVRRNWPGSASSAARRIQQRMVLPALQQLMHRRDMHRRHRIVVVIQPAPSRSADLLAQAQQADQANGYGPCSASIAGGDAAACSASRPPVSRCSPAAVASSRCATAGAARQAASADRSGQSRVPSHPGQASRVLRSYGIWFTEAVACRHRRRWPYAAGSRPPAGPG